MKSRKRFSGEIFYNIFEYLFLGLFALVTIYPFYNVLVVSLTTESALIHDPMMLYPKEFTLMSYQTILRDPNFIRAFCNSILVAVLGTAYSMILTICCSYVLTKTQVKGIKFFFGMIIVTMFFNGGLIPTYLNIQSLHIMNSIWAVILPAGINTFYMILMVNSIRHLPASLEESARIDGAGDGTILFRIIVPLCKPTIMAILLFTIVDRWNEWYSVMLYLNDPKKWPLTYVLRNMLIKITSSTDPATQRLLAQKEVFSSGLQRAAIILTILPIMLIYPFLQKYFTKGIMVGAIKG